MRQENTQKGPYPDFIQSQDNRGSEKGFAERNLPKEGILIRLFWKIDFGIFKNI